MWHGTHDLGVARRYRRSVQYEVYIPDPLTGRTVLLTPDVAESLSQATRLIQQLNETEPVAASLEAAARLLLRAEAVASSRIEGLQIGARRLLRAEAGREIGSLSRERDSTADAVLDNIEAMRFAVGNLAMRERLSLDDLLEMHKVLMSHSQAGLGGVIRTTQNWIGKTDYGPYDADFVPPPPEFVPDLLDDLVAYLNTDEHPALLQAALSHAQFETVHPFGDGNGRVGRALIHVVLRRRGLATRFVPPISLVLATHSRDYMRGLAASQYRGDAGDLKSIEGTAEWLTVFAAAVARAAYDAAKFGERIVALEQQWRREAKTIRMGSAADLLVGALASAPIITVSTAARLVKRSLPATNAAIEQLVSAGVLLPIREVRRNRAFEAKGLVDMFTTFERALASPVGDTRLVSPARAVPYPPRTTTANGSPNL